MKGHRNGYCYKEHIYGILHAVEIYSNLNWYARPLPIDNFEEVSLLYANGEMTEAEQLCLPIRRMLSSSSSTTRRD